jgi:hypothetical protein
VKAPSVYENLLKDDDDEDNAKPFSASTSWFSKFTNRYNLNYIKMTGKTASPDTVAAETFFTALEINRHVYTVQKRIYTVYTVHIYSTGLYVQYWHRHTLYSMRSSIC